MGMGVGIGASVSQDGGGGLRYTCTNGCCTKNNKKSEKGSAVDILLV